MPKHYTPYDLAEFVSKEVERSKIKSAKPSRKILDELFNTLYYTSLQTEEGQFIKVTVTLIDPATILEFDEVKDHCDKWQYYPFEPQIEFTVKNLVKLSKAADPWSASLAVYYDENEDLFIYGMIDQSIHYQSFLNYEKEDKPQHPGILQVMINGIGILNVMLDFQALATLNQSSLVKLYPNVFEFGPISDFLRHHSIFSHKSLEEIIGEKLSRLDADDFNETVRQNMIQAICRILLKIKNYHHGGAILITTNTTADLQTKYKLKYDRVRLSIGHLLNALADEEFLAAQIKSNKSNGKTMPISLHQECDDNELDLEDILNEHNGAIRFVSSLSCVDGLVLMSPRLEVHGFGTVITEKYVPPTVYVSKGSTPSETAVPMNSDHFGTRHRSMFSYCLKHPESVGFVVSQDGEIRAIKCEDGKVFIWENIKVYQFQRSNKLPKLVLLPKKK